MKIYKSISVKLFDIWRILFYGMIILFIVLFFLLGSGKVAFYSTLVIIPIIILIQFIVSYTTVTSDKQNIKIQNVLKNINLKNHTTTSTWWSYDIGSSSFIIGAGNVGKTRALTNKINIYAKFEGDGEPLFIYEQIHLGSKFPNNHPYSANKEIDKNRMMGVWDVDKCLEKLNLHKKPT